MKQRVVSSLGASVIALMLTGAASASVTFMDYGRVDPATVTEITQPTPVSVTGTAAPGHQVVDIVTGQPVPGTQDDKGWDPFGTEDNTLKWIDIGSNNASATYALGGGVDTELSIVWGSPNDNNTVTFYDASNNVIGAVHAADLVGTVNSTAPGYDIEFVTSVPFAKVKFSSEISAFEFAVLDPGVPEPSTWAMMGLGFLGLAFAGRRARRRSPAAAAL